MPEITVSGAELGSEESQEVQETLEVETDGETETESVSDEMEIVEESSGEGQVSGNMISGEDTSELKTMISDLQQSNAELRALYEQNAVSASEPETEVYYDSLEEFTSQPVAVDLYQYTILTRLEFIQYGLVIMVALLFLILFRRK